MRGYIGTFFLQERMNNLIILKMLKGSFNITLDSSSSSSSTRKDDITIQWNETELGKYWRYKSWRTFPDLVNTSWMLIQSVYLRQTIGHRIWWEANFMNFGFLSFKIIMVCKYYNEESWQVIHLNYGEPHILETKDYFLCTTLLFFW